MKTVLVVLALAAPAATPVTCNIKISYPSDKPGEVEFNTPSKDCDVKGMEIAVRRTLHFIETRE